MPVRIRLARHGRAKAPVYHLVAINSKRPREGRPLETLGTYDPIPRLREGVVVPSAANVFGSGVESALMVKKEKKIEWNVDRIRYWLGVGAQPTRTVVKLLERGGVLTTPHKWQHQWSPAPPASASASTSAASTSTTTPNTQSST